MMILTSLFHFTFLESDVTFACDVVVEGDRVVRVNDLTSMLHQCFVEALQLLRCQSHVLIQDLLIQLKDKV